MTIPQVARPFFMAFLVISALLSPKKGQAQYVPADPALYKTILQQDSLFFAAYNTCSVHLEEYGAYYAENVEFYHDKGGLSTSKKDIIEATKKNICGKVTRELVPGSVEVYPIANFGAIEIGFHTFRNKENPPGTIPKPDRFVIVWQQTDKGWKITRVISLH